MTAAARVLQVARFALWTNLRSGLTRGGLVLGSILMLAGPAVAVAHDLAWSFDPQFGFFGFLVTALFGLRSGLQEQRELGMMTFFRHNVLRPTEHALAMVVSLLGSWIAVCAGAFLAILVISGGGARVAGWYAASWGFRALLLLGFVPLVEQVASFRLPLLIPALGYLILLVTLTILLPESGVVAVFIPVEPGDLSALRRLGVQAVGALAATSLLLVMVTGAEAPVRRCLRRIVPLGH